MEFDSEEKAYDFYNTYGGRIGFSIRKEYGNKVNGRITSRAFVCNKEGVKGTDKWDVFKKTPRAETRTNCGAQMRRISSVQAIDVELASDLGVPACNAYELMGRQSGGKESVGYLKVDLKNYLRTRRQKELLYGEAAWLVYYFETHGCEDPSLFYSLQLDTEQIITNIFWSDCKMIIDYGQFGDVISFDTTYKVVHGNRPFAIFLGMNHHQGTAMFGAALMYNETADSFVWLFEMFLKAMGGKAPKTIITDQDAVMVKAVMFPIFKYGVAGNKWLSTLLDLRHKWALAFVKHDWSARMSSTLLSDKRYKEYEAGYGLVERQPELKTKCHILRQAGKVYPKAIFQLFQEEFLAALASQVVISCTDLDKNGHHVYKVASKDGVQHRVSRTFEDELSCSCCKFQREGYLCRHSLKILKNCMFVNELPSRYIIKRWTRNARDGRLEEIVSTDVNPDPQLEIRRRHRTLCRILTEISSIASHDPEGYNDLLAKHWIGKEQYK
ncbi:protein FAR1-RELATED SEQUENCE 7-like [Cornus florida]|uniref:protein FAR1-RELATED SEQUENCE 7-like n=1 Tax=Cornus florida TaxID=4283 RepID=UPI00289F66B7|nr:protein FAR1-RELATED SEQUENCE 7-like [Cornus florida]